MTTDNHRHPAHIARSIESAYSQDARHLTWLAIAHNTHSFST